MKLLVMLNGHGRLCEKDVPPSSVADAIVRIRRTVLSVAAIKKEPDTRIITVKAHSDITPDDARQIVTNAITLSY